MGHLRSNRAVRWFAPLALVGAVGLVACGDSSTDADVSARTVAPAEVVGSDVHLANQAAEIAERTQHLAGNAQTHATPDDTSDATDDEFVPGSRRMPTR